VDKALEKAGADAKGGPSTWQKIKDKIGSNKGAAAGVGAGAAGVAGLGLLARLGLSGLGKLAILKWMMDHWGSHELAAGKKDSNPSGHVYAAKGQIKGMPTRRSLERVSMGESSEENDKIRRDVEYVARRDGDRKKKGSMGRQKAVQTNVIDEGFPWVEIAKMAVKEKMRRDAIRKQQKLTPGENQTGVNTDPKLQPPPQDSR
jgi:hypothetical protein